jgi:hypothetical protein
MPAATKPAAKKSTATKQHATPTAKNDTTTVTKGTTTAAKDAKTVTAKPTPPSNVAEYIATLTADEQRYGRKAWRHCTGQRGTAPSLRGIAPERAKAIRERVAELAR